MRKIRTFCLITGITLLLAALFLCIYNIHEDEKGGEQAKNIVTVIRSAIPETIEETTEKQYDLFAEYETEAVPTEAVLEIENSAYIGVLEIPELAIELPVMNEWSYPNLKISPCRYMGSVYTDDLIICAHNYTTHFGQIKNLHTDSELIFTEVTGKKHLYRVINIEELPGTAVEQMQCSDADNWDLTLFTCTLSGQTRVTVRAAKTETEE